MTDSTYYRVFKRHIERSQLRTFTAFRFRIKEILRDLEQDNICIDWIEIDYDDIRYDLEILRNTCAMSKEQFKKLDSVLSDLNFLISYLYRTEPQELKCVAREFNETVDRLRTF